MLAGAVTATIILVAWLPLGALLAQRDALSSASGRLTQLNAEGRALTQQAARLRTPAMQDQLARELYQLVEPGQRLVQVLAPTFHPSSTRRTTGAPFPGDPGYAAIVDPTDVAGSVSAAPSSAAARHPAHPGAPGFLSRVLATLEFWR